jgi:hypothetical protein
VEALHFVRDQNHEVIIGGELYSGTSELQREPMAMYTNTMSIRLLTPSNNERKKEIAVAVDDLAGGTMAVLWTLIFPFLRAYLWLSSDLMVPVNHNQIILGSSIPFCEASVAIYGENLY